MSNPSIVSLLGQMGAPRLYSLFAQEPHRAAQWVRVLAAEGLPKAQLCYGRLLLEGTGVAQDTAAALLWFRRAAAHGDLDAVNMVGRCHDNGWGTREDPAQAAVHYTQAADAGHAWAQYNVGHLHLDGRGVVRNLPQAFACYRRSAEQQHERAMNLVGRCCEEGWGTPRDPEAAAEWYRRSAERGYCRGQFNWATWLLAGGRDDEAALWFERAALAGTPGVRAAVCDVLGRAGAGSALRSLAVRLAGESPRIAPPPGSHSAPSSAGR